MRVLIIGATTRSLWNFRGKLIESIIENGNEVVTCAGEFHEQTVNWLKSIGADYIPIQFQRAGVNPFQDILYFLRLYKVIRKERPDILISYTSKPVIYGSLAARLAGVPKICSMITGLGLAFQEGKGAMGRSMRRLAEFLYRFSLRHNHVVFFQNPDDLGMFDRLRLIGEQAKRVLLNGSGVDLSEYQPCSLPEGRTRFLLIARLLHHKGIADYSQAAKKLEERYPDTVFSLLGPFDSNPNTLSQENIDEMVQEGAVEYHGETDDVRPFLHACNVFVLPSYRREGQPRSVLEAMAIGRPIITTDTPGCRETVELTGKGIEQKARCEKVLEGRNGFLVEPRNIDALFEAMERLIKEPELRTKMARESLRIAEDKYDVRKVNRIILEAIEL